MKKKPASQSAFFNRRTLLGLTLCLFGFIVTLFAAGVLPGVNNAPSGASGSIPRTGFPQANPGSQKPDVGQMIGPVVQDKDLRLLPYIAPNPKEEEFRLTRYPHPMPHVSQISSGGVSNLGRQVVQAALAASLPSPMLTFDIIDSNLSGCGCLPPDSDGDVGSNNYVASINSSIMIFNKNGNALAGPITYNSFFSALGTGTPCGNNQNDGDGIAFYDHIADRWVVSDFAFPSNNSINYQCIGVSRTNDPVAGGWYLYAQQIDANNPTYFGDYPKFGLWPDAYYLSVNLFDSSSNFQGVRVFAFNRANMINGGPANTVAFSIVAANLGDQYSLLPATFRTGAPPVGQPEWFMDTNSPSNAAMVENTVYVRRFHVDFVTPSNSTFGSDANHDPDGTITVNNYTIAASGSGTAETTYIVPNGTGTTTQWLDTLGDKLMYPLVYQNINGKEYIYADGTILPPSNTGPTIVRWYQFDMTGNTIPATPTQQQDFNNGGDGLYRWMPSINVDGSGDMAIGYSVSSSTLNPGIRYAGRLYADTGSTLTQGETIMWAGTGHQTSTADRWGDYSALFVDPIDNCTFWHTNEYYSVTGSANWRNRVGLFKFSQCSGAPLPSPTPTPTATPVPTATPFPTVPPTPTPTPVTSPTPSPTPPVSNGPVTITATAGTTGPTDYSTVQAAFAAINAGTHQGAISVWLLGSTVETASAVLSAPVAPASYSSILMLPNGTQSVTGNLAAPLIDLNGAKNVRIDGYNMLTLSNTNTGSTAGTSTVRFISTTAAAGGAQNNILANCTILGSSTVAEGAAGGNVLFSTTTANGTNIVGNNNNIVANNNIGPAGGNMPIKCITALGTAGNNTRNTDNVITNNNIFDFFNATSSVTGVDIRAGNYNSTISNNQIYETATRTFTGAAGLRWSGILFSGTTGANGDFNTISGNTIGFAAANGTGTLTITGTGTGAQCEVRGIDLQGSATNSATSVQGNVVSGINLTSARASTTTGLSAFAGISASTSAGASATGQFDIGTVTGNTIGSLDGSSTIVVNATSTTASTTPIFGILAFSGSSDLVNNNRIGAVTIQGSGTVTGFRGIFDGATATTTHTINNNFIGGAVAGGAITDTQVGSYSMYGIQTSTAAVSVNGNTIQNMSGNSNGASLIVTSGLEISSTSTSAVSHVSQNNIFNLSNSSGAASNSIYAIDLTMSTSAAVAANLVERNFVHSLSLTSTTLTSQIYGIVMRGQGNATIQNNMIQLGLDASGNSITSGLSFAGILDIAGATSSYYFNSVYIGGSGVASSSNTFAFDSAVTTNTRNYKNNIFFNARSNASGTATNYAIAVGGTAPNPAGLTTNYNDLYATGTGGAVGLFNSVTQTTLANWQTATGQDANSISADPMFVNPNGAATTGDLHIQTGSPAIGAGTPITVTTASPLTGILNDLDGITRSVTTPTVGADELAAAPGIQSVVSRLTHGSAGTFDLPLSTATCVSGNPFPGTIEPRSDGTGNFTIVFNFNQSVNSGNASVTAGTGSVSSVTFSSNSMIVSLSGVTDQQIATVTTSGVAGSYTLSSSPSVQVGFLNGDVNGDGFVNVGDVILERNNAGSTVNGSNFQFDVNLDGFINSGDTIIVRTNSGNGLPTCP